MAWAVCPRDKALKEEYGCDRICAGKKSALVLKKAWERKNKMKATLVHVPTKNMAWAPSSDFVCRTTARQYIKGLR